MALTWSDAFSVGIPSIDQQHMKLIDIINQVEESLIAGGDSANLVEAIQSLSAYVSEHFTYEEELMGRHDFAGLSRHLHQHKYFSDKIDNIRMRLSREPEVAARDLLSFLNMWLIDHISHSDKQYSAFLISCGVN